MEAPQIAATASRSQGLPPKRKPITRQQAPETAIATEVTAVRPTRSAARPATMQPTNPAPITRKAIISASAGRASPRAAKLSRAKTGNHVHIA